MFLHRRFRVDVTSVKVHRAAENSVQSVVVDERFQLWCVAAIKVIDEPPPRGSLSDCLIMDYKRSAILRRPFTDLTATVMCLRACAVCDDIIFSVHRLKECNDLASGDGPNQIIYKLLHKSAEMVSIGGMDRSSPNTHQKLGLCNFAIFHVGRSSWHHATCNCAQPF